MKNIIAFIAVLLLTFAPIPSRADNPRMSKKPVATSATEKESAELKALINRVNEINAMDPSTMTASEKKAIRKELRAINKEVKHKHHSGGVYISTGVLILILVLIIIF